MPNERNCVRKGDSPKRIHRKRGRVCRCITANTRAICVADTIVRVNRCTPVIVAALIDSRSRRDVTHHVHFLDDNIRDSAKGITQEPPSRVVLGESVVFRDIKRTCVVRLMQLISRYSKNVVQLYG